jgi:hypothetical protein
MTNNDNLDTDDLVLVRSMMPPPKRDGEILWARVDPRGLILQRGNNKWGMFFPDVAYARMLALAVNIAAVIYLVAKKCAALVGR